VPKLCQSGTDQRQVRIWETSSGRQLRSLWLTNWVETMSGRGNRIFLRNTTNQPPGYTVLEPTTGRVVASLMATGEFAFRFSNFVNAEETDSCVNPRLPAVSADGRWLLTQTLNKVPNPRPGEAARSKGSGAILILPLMDRPRPPDNQGLRFQWTVWDVDQAQPVARLPESEAPLVFAAFSPDGKILFTWDHSFSEDRDQSHGRGAFWETSTGRQVSTFSLPGRTHYFHSRAVFSGDGRRLLIARNTSPEWPVEVWDVRSGRLVASLLKYDGELGALALSPDGSLALTADRIVRVWDATKGTELTSFAGHADRVVCAAFSPDGRFVATGSRDKTARLWPLECGRLQMSQDANLTFATGVDFSAKGRYALAYQYSSENGGTGSVVTVWDYTTARKISDLALAEKWEEILLLPDDVHLVALNPGNRAGSGGRAQVYELLSGRVNHTFQADQLGLAPGSGRLIGVEQRRLPGPGTSFNFLIRTWDAASGKLVATNHLVGVSLGLLSDGKHALVGVNDGQHQL
jgi:WD40 repeat protein